MALSAMKASRVTEFFAADIARWERTLASMSETLEAVLQVWHIITVCILPFCTLRHDSSGAERGQVETQSKKMQVQTTWTYLESIFGASSEDVRRQLPTHSALFDSVHAAFKQAMASIFASRASAVQVQSPHMHEQSLNHGALHIEGICGA